MPFVPALISFRPLWLAVAVVSVAGCQALVGDLPEPVALSSDGGSTADGGGTASGGEGGSGGKGVPTDGGGGGSPQSSGGSSAGGAGGTGGERDGGASGGAVVDPTDGGGDASVDGGDGGDGGGAPGSGGTASGGSGGSATGGSVGTGGATGGTGGATGGTGGAIGGTGGATGGTGGKGTGGTGTCTTDFDKDGFIAKACGGTDCDDADFDAKPGQTAFPQDARTSGGYDYNCDNVITKDPALNRTVNCGVVLASCPTTAQGYFGTNAADVPQCGASASWGTCAKSGLLCEKVPVASVRMGCR